MHLGLCLFLLDFNFTGSYALLIDAWQWGTILGGVSWLSWTKGSFFQAKYRNMEHLTVNTQTAI